MTISVITLSRPSIHLPASLPRRLFPSSMEVSDQELYRRLCLGFPEILDVICCTALFSTTKAETVAEYLNQRYGWRDPRGGQLLGGTTGRQVRTLFWWMWDQRRPRPNPICEKWRKIEFPTDQEVIDIVSPIIDSLRGSTWYTHMKKDHDNLNLPSWGRSLEAEMHAAEEKYWREITRQRSAP